MQVGTGFFKRNNRIMVSAPRNLQSSKEDGDVKDCWDLLNHLTLEFASDWEVEGTVTMKNERVCS